MDGNGGFLEMLLLSLMMVSASRAWHSLRLCPDQRLGIGDDCTRHPQYCPVGAVCEWSGQTYKCRLGIGDDCTRHPQYCPVGAVCEQSGQTYTCRLGIGDDCTRYPQYCPVGAVCEQSGQMHTCKTDTGGACSDDDECKIDDICFQEKCVCGDRLSGSEGVLTSPNYPNNYPYNARCVWIITASEGRVVKLNFTDFEVEYSDDAKFIVRNACDYDYLQLVNGTDPDAPVLETICGKGDPGPSYSPGNVLLLQFVSDELNSFSGFRIEYSFVLPGP